ncbi:MAG TPA: DNA recombination protein RmuC [Thermodesulfobacteriota bacterium]
MTEAPPAALLAAAALVAAAAVAVALALRKRPSGDGVAAALGSLAQGVAAVQTTVAAGQAELRALSERVLALEQRQSRVDQGIAGLGAGLAEQRAMARGLAEATAAIRDGLGRAAEELASLRTHARARQELEARTAESIRRLEAVIAGSQTKGAAGEQILESVFARLPPEWQVRNFRVGDRTVEFGLRLPNRLVLPIDSKWAATPLVERFAAAEDPAERERLRAEIEAAVLARAREVRKYLDPRVTASFGVAAVPDAVYDLCAGIHADAFQSSVVLVSYSLFVPYLLLVFQTTLRAERHVDLERLEAFLASVERHLGALQEELDGRLARSITMLQNARADMGAHLARVASGLAALGIHAGSEAASGDGAERERGI